MCLTRSHGGLGFRLIKDVNLALIAKLGWKLLSNSSNHQVSQLKAKYFRTCMIWNDILQFQDLISSRACHKIHRNSPHLCLIPPWIPTFPSFKPFPRHHSNLSHSTLMVSDLFFPNSHLLLPQLRVLLDSPLRKIHHPFQPSKYKPKIDPQPLSLLSPIVYGKPSIS